MSVIWLDGKFVRSERATIPLLSHALHYGTGAFEGIRAYKTAHGPAVFRLLDHVERFFHSIAALGVKIPYSKHDIEKAICATVRRNGFNECYIRPIAFFGEGSMSLAAQGARFHVAIMAWPWAAYLGEHPTLSVGISRYIRFDPRSIVPGAKISGYYATSVLATLDAKKRGYDECVLLDHRGYIAEGSWRECIPGEARETIYSRLRFAASRDHQKEHYGHRRIHEHSGE